MVIIYAQYGASRIFEVKHDVRTAIHFTEQPTVTDKMWQRCIGGVPCAAGTVYNSSIYADGVYRSAHTLFARPDGELFPF